MKSGEILKLLKVHGWEFWRTAKGGHQLWKKGDRILLYPHNGRSRDMTYHAQRSLLSEIRR